MSDYVKVLHVDKFHVPEIVNPLFNICYFHGSVYSHGGVLDYDTLSQCSRWIPMSSIQPNHLSLRLGIWQVLYKWGEKK
jgi:hypothetical protein